MDESKELVYIHIFFVFTNSISGKMDTRLMYIRLGRDIFFGFIYSILGKIDYGLMYIQSGDK